LKLKPILICFIQFFLSVVVTAFIGLMIIKVTVLNEGYMKDVFHENDYYKKVSVAIKEDMKNYLIQSGFTEEILKELYTEEDIERELNYIIDCVYQNQKIEIDTSVMEEKLESAISEYLLTKNMEVDSSEDMDKFVDLMMDVYLEEMTFSNQLTRIQSIFTKVSNILDKGILFLGIAFIGLFILGKVFYRKILLAIPLLAASISFVAGVIYLKNALDIKNLLLFSQDASDIIRFVFFDVLHRFIVVAIILFIIALVMIVVRSLYAKKVRR